MMSRNLGVWLVVTWLMLPALPVQGWDGAAGADQHGDGHGKPAKYKAHVHEHTAEGKHVEVEKKFDLSKDADKQQFIDHLLKGEVHEVKLDKPPELLELKADLGIWSIVVFIALFYVLQRFAWPLILEGLQSREAKIVAARDEAEKTRAEAQRLQEELATQLAHANDKVREIMEDARRDAARVTEDLIAKARTEIQADRDRLKREMDSARDAALKELWEQSVQLASMISTKAIRRSLDTETHHRLFDVALAELSVQESLMKG